MAERDRRRGCGGGGDVSWSRFFWCTIFAVLCCVLFTVFTFSTLRLSFGETFQLVVVPSWRNPAMRAVSGDSEPGPSVSISETVIFPDRAMIFLKYPPSSRLFTREDIHCVYVAASDLAKLRPKQPPASVDSDDSGEQIVRCPLAENGSLVSLAFESDEHVPPGPSHRWDSLVYEAVTRVKIDDAVPISTAPVARRHWGTGPRRCRRNKSDLSTHDYQLTTACKPT